MALSFTRKADPTLKCREEVHVPGGKKNKCSNEDEVKNYWPVENLFSNVKNKSMGVIKSIIS